MSELEQMEARLNNAEIALMSVCDLLLHLQPPDTQQRINTLMQDYYEANKQLGMPDGGEFKTNSK